MKSYIFILGRTPALAFLELATFFPTIKECSSDAALLPTDLPLSPDEVLSRLGGTVKIAEMVGKVTDVTPEAIAGMLDTTHGRVVFGVSSYVPGKNFKRSFLEDVKALVEGYGASVRFVEGRSGDKTLSSVVVSQDKMQEIVIVPDGDCFLVGRTVAVQPFENWGDRDFGRPHADPKAGMLPPKVSRMVVNIADRSRDITKPLSQKTLLDPFCGMGTILGEALVMGWNVIGSDISERTVLHAKENLHWLLQRAHIENVIYRTQVSDAVHVSDIMDAGSIDAIVTEPYMGPTDLATTEKKPEEVKNIVKGLEKLFIGCLRDWHKVLKPGGVIMVAIPKYLVRGREYSVKKVIDMCEVLGYTIVTGPIEYSRPQAVVTRGFYLFQKK